MTATRRLTLVWVLLLALTFGSFVIGVDQTFASAGTLTIVGIAMLKVRLIGIHFMDVRVAPRPLRLLFEGYVLAVFVTLVALDRLTAHGIV